MIEILIAYFVVGFFAILVTGVIVHKSEKPVFNPWEILLDLPLALIFWPLWIGISIAEWWGVKIITRSTQDASDHTLHTAKSHDQSALPEVGDVGVTETIMKPGGRVQFGEQRSHGIAEEGFLEKGVRVKVVRRSLSDVIVKQVP